jgi:dienelactone hydrolase
VQSLSDHIERTAMLVDVGPFQAFGELTVPADCRGLVVLVRGLGERAHGARDHAIVAALGREGLGALVCDLYSADERALDRLTRHLRYDAAVLAERAAAVVDWLRRRKRFAGLGIGLFGTGTGAAAAVIASTQSPHVAGVVACGARTELRRDTLESATVPLLFVAAGADGDAIASHCRAVRQLRAPASTHLVSRARRLDEPAALGELAEVAAAWFSGCLERRDECQLAVA